MLSGALNLRTSPPVEIHRRWLDTPSPWAHPFLFKPLDDIKRYSMFNRAVTKPTHREFSYVDATPWVSNPRPFGHTPPLNYPDTWHVCKITKHTHTYIYIYT